MEWLILVLVVPAILIPVVVLWGFAGCGFSAHAAPGAETPTNVRASGTSASTIAVTWDNPNTEPVSFLVERKKEGESIPLIFPASSTTFPDTGLDEAATYFYQVRAVLIPSGSQSNLSDQASGRTFGTAFDEPRLSSSGIDQSGLDGFCLVQRIEPTRLAQSTVPGGLTTQGARVRITLRGSTAANLILDRIFISQAAAVDPYDSQGDLMHVASNAVVDAGLPVVLPDIDYDLDRTKPLLIAFDINAASGSGNVRFVANVPEAEATMYFRPATAAASLADRPPSGADPTPFSVSKSIYLVEKIEVV